ncbi:ATP-dependent DNA helicase PIF1 [Coprinopsis cinerea okayama7|uniref:ATP-dependent DNA helicase n=1 Tax=Coprinopsis cinerea (strain Okayama-7 / 130 / ATCC MYA-4618 / FGSC 9003) TaxID=240176 RepID=A8NBF5_COPC7|nr:ATP-dependent DNA helicase PIF1 [Coprinopsis cinerea okayama7\|eukprot:XP_001832153.2 ATP-dependent DNA helicase PIF1 [Coprinopsis cinerea okayama7\
MDNSYSIWCMAEHAPQASLVVNETGPSSEIAALISLHNTAVSDVSGRRLVISRQNNSNYRIANVSRLWEPLSYPLLFPHATLGWGLFGSVTDANGAAVLNGDIDREATTTQMWHYRARLLREERFSIFGRLTCEYLVDMHTRDLESRLAFIQRSLEDRRTREDAQLMGEEEVEPNENIYLPASFLGSRKWASEQVSDSLAIAAALGTPTFFVTMTCNPEWPEIQSQLRPGQDYSDVPLVVVRVFKQKVRQLLKALKTMFPNAGSPIYTIQCVEFQKRGLPHIHILIKYRRDCSTPQHIDSVVSAELPNDPVDRELIQKFMMHNHPPENRPPSTYCQREQADGSRKCRFNYPFPITPTTTISPEGRVFYRRRSAQDCMVVPHCLPLIRMMKCHINFEIASTSHLFQYLFQVYSQRILLGPDRARYRILDDNNPEVINEIEDFWNARYLSAGEAAWRILGFRITQKDPSVTALPVHDQDNIRNQRYSRRSDEGSLSKLERYFLRPDGTFLYEGQTRNFDDLTYTEYFTLFRIDPYNPEKDGHPRYYRERPNGLDAPRMHVILRAGSITHLARIQNVRQTQGQTFYLRAILTQRAARSYEDVRTVNGVQFRTYQEAAIAMGIFTDDDEAIFAIAEAIAALRTPREIRVLFVHLLVNDCVPAPLLVWDEFWESLAYDFTLRNNGNIDLGRNEALQEMGHYLGEYGKTLSDYGLPQPVERMAELTAELRRWSGREQELNAQAEASRRLFNDEQSQVYETIMEAIEMKIPLSLFVDGKAGTGKTTVIRALCNKLRAQGRVVLPTASSAFAAQLYDGGRTTHSTFKVSDKVFQERIVDSLTFKVPVNEKNEMLQSPIRSTDARAELIREASLIIWDEAPMANRAVLSCVDDVLRDVMGTDIPFGGKVIVLLGDFRQTCPVVRGGSRAEVVAASIKSSPLWRYFTIARLIHPIRNAEDPEFATFVNAIGDGGGPDIPLTGLRTVTEESDLTSFVFPDEILLHPTNCVKRAILAPTNRQVDRYNTLILNRLPGHNKTYYAADKLKEVEDAEVPAPEAVLDYVMRHTPPGLPPHAVSVKVGSVCRLLRNFSIDRGLVKNARVLVKGVGTRLITVQIVRESGVQEGEDILIPRITFEANLYSGHTLCRRQFPLAPAYATTFNSCQGLTLDRVGIDLTSPVFSHGQLYTAMSRIRNRHHAIVRMDEGQASTTNVTYLEILE